MSEETMLTMRELEELLRHPSPGSRAAMHQVRRLVAAGMPCVRSVRPMLFPRAGVLSWLEELARPKRRRGAGRRASPRAESRGAARSALATLIDELRREPDR